MYASSLRRRIFNSLLSLRNSPVSRRTITYTPAMPFSQLKHTFLGRDIISSPWSLTQHRGAKVFGTDIRRGNVIQRKGRIFQVLETQHTQHGRGGATIQVELRDVDSGNKTSERFRTDEAIERVFVEEKSFSFLYEEGDSLFIMDPNTFEQMELSKEMLGKASVYLKDDMPVNLQLYDGKPMSASIPRRITCTVAEAQPHSKGQTAQPQYKRIVVDNGVEVYAPSYIKIGEKVVIDTIDNTYIARYKD